ncbi:hypothetical protein [Hydrogenophaga atypica]|uniref:Uncharacterized protein n=1 Tax=Hydrogenophaga atypica TaxID=249409 RepID=A0ABW2QQN6_9BURK
MDAKTNPATSAVDTRALLHTLHEAAQSSAHVAELSRLVVTYQYESNAAVAFALTSAIEVLSQRAGWLADLASVRLGNKYGARGADANVWFMPSGIDAAKAEG